MRRFSSFLITLICSLSVFGQWAVVRDMTFVGYSGSHIGYSPVDLTFFNDSVGFFTQSKYFSPSSGTAFDWYKTGDFGKNWSTTFSTGGPVFGASGGKLQALRGDTGVMGYGVAPSYSFKRTFDAGNGWSGPGVPSTSNFYFLDPMYGVGIYNANIFRLINTSVAFTGTISGTPTSEFCLSTKAKILVVTNSKNLQTSADTGYTWTTILSPNLNLNHICFPSPLTGYIACDSGRIFKTINGGTSWTQIQTCVKTKLNYLSFKNDSVGYCATEKGIVLKTFDHGLSWKKDSLPTSNSLKKVWVKNKKVYAFDGSYLFIGVIDTCSIRQNVTITTPTSSVCYSLTAALSGTPAGGYFVGQGVTGSTFYPPSPPITYYVSYVYRDPLKNCAYSDTKSITVDPFCSEIGIDEMINNSKGITIFPNPFDEEFRIETDQEFEDVEIRIRDILGRNVEIKNILSSKSATFNTRELTEGVYFVEIKKEGGTYFTRKIVKSRN